MVVLKVVKMDVSVKMKAVEKVYTMVQIQAVSMAA
jgi:hypothetical protein